MALDLEPIRSRIEELAEIRTKYPEEENMITSEEDDLFKDCSFQLMRKFNEIIGEYSDVSPLEAEDVDAYLENLKGELCSVEVENAQLSGEVENLMKGYSEDSRRLQCNIEELNSNMEIIQSQGMETKRAGAPLECSLLVEHEPENTGAHGDCKFKLLKLNSEIEKNRGILKSLEDLDYILKRFEGVNRIEDALSGLKVIDYDGKRISLSLRTYIPETEMAEQNHELSIEFFDKTLELKNAEIFPNDVYIGEIIDAAKSFEHQLCVDPIFEEKSSLELLVRRVQDRIVLSTLRKSLVKDANKSRHSMEYIDRDEMIVAHMVDGIDAFVKPSQAWPVSPSPLHLLSLKASPQSSKELTFSFLCKVEEMVSSLDVKVCENLSTFMDAVEEIFKQRMRVQLQSGATINN